MAGRKAELETELAGLRAELGSVEGRPTEVYSRIVGYYRSVRNWNAGKREEYAARLTYAMPRLAASAGTRVDPAAALPSEAPSLALGGETRRFAAAGLLLFTRAACPNCPPVKDYLLRSGLEARAVDVDSEEGLALARHHGVLSTPTVLGLDGTGAEAFRARSVAELQRLLPAAVL